MVDLWRKKNFRKNFKKNFDPKKLGFFFKTWFVKKYLAQVKKWWHFVKSTCLEYMKTCLKNQKFSSFSLSETDYFWQSASGYPVVCYVCMQCNVRFFQIWYFYTQIQQKHVFIYSRTYISEFVMKFDLKNFKKEPFFPASGSYFWLYT